MGENTPQTTDTPAPKAPVLIPTWREGWRYWSNWLAAAVAVYATLPADWQAAVLGVVTDAMALVGLERQHALGLLALAWIGLRMLNQGIDAAAAEPVRAEPPAQG